MTIERAQRVAGGSFFRLLHDLKANSWRGVVGSHTLRPKGSAMPSGGRTTDSVAAPVFRHVLLAPNGLEVPVAEGQRLVSLTPELARAVKTVLTDARYVIEKGYYNLRAEPVVSDSIEIGRRLVWARLAEADLRLEVEAGVRALLGEAGAAVVDQTMPKMWENLQNLISLLPERIEGPIGYYHGKAPAALRTNDVQLPEGMDIMVGTEFIAAHGTGQVLLRLLAPVREQIEFLWQTVPDEPTSASPSEIILDGSTSEIELGKNG